MTETTGFDLPERTALLVFEEPYEGAQVRVRLDVPLALFLKIEQMAEANQHLQTYGPFAKEVLVDWNLRVKGKPIEATPEGFMQLPPAFAQLVVSEWAKAVGEVASPLGEPSVNGVTSAVPSEATAGA